MTQAASVRPGSAWLFCPADRPERFAEAAAIADMVILDLEDGVAAADTVAARNALQDAPLDPLRTVVRLSAASSDDHGRDIEALSRTEYTTVMVPKAERADQLVALAPLSIVVLVETPRGVLRAQELAAPPNVVGMMWGAEDMFASLGGGSSRHSSGVYRDVARHTRSTVLLAAASCNRYALDAVHLAIADFDGLAPEASEAANDGFTGTVCIHPDQVPIGRNAYRPSADDLRWAQQVLDAAQNQKSVFAFHGGMVDAPRLRQAEAISRRAANISQTPPASPSRCERILYACRTILALLAIRRSRACVPW